MNNQVLDPVCGMMVNPEIAVAHSEYNGKSYYFCAPGCKAAFDKNPKKYLQNQHSHGHGHHYQQ